eukprot:1399045-Rhodomonas_salina.1
MPPHLLSVASPSPSHLHVSSSTLLDPATPPRRRRPASSSESPPCCPPPLFSTQASPWCRGPTSCTDLFLLLYYPLLFITSVRRAVHPWLPPSMPSPLSLTPQALLGLAPRPGSSSPPCLLLARVVILLPILNLAA